MHLAMYHIFLYFTIVSNQFYKLCIIIFHKRLKHIFTNSFSEDMNNVD